ncbi:BMP family ABC transporter substrate-binding protein [Streptomyces sp. NPDC093595]|uniref:BMP family ABC transporter substrate-binding protein n=1 Tax=Streptomyces sp. NPDC093595 TaxID=3366045 RepID=UPI0038283C0C
MLLARLRMPRGRAAWAAGSAAVLVLGLVAVALFVGGGQDGPPDPRARQYKDVDACLLTGEKGVAAGTPAAAVWQAMQKASLDTRSRVNYVPVMGEQTAANARPFFNSLMQRKCAVVFAVGAPQVQATVAGAKEYPDARFVVVDGDGAGQRNVTAVRSGDAAELDEAVESAIRRAVKASETSQK